MKIVLLINLLFFFVFADEIQKSEPSSSGDLLIIEDRSGLSDDEVRAIATKSDKKDKKLHLKDVYEATDANGSVDMSKIQAKWEELSPTPVKYDWVQTTSQEWFKGEIKALYDDKLEFESDEMGLYSFDFDDVVQIKSYNIISVNIENKASLAGVIRLKDKSITVIQGDKKFEFAKENIVSFAPNGELERNLWSGKVSIGLDVRKGNTEQQDFSATVHLQRRTAESRLALDYLGRISSKDHEEISNDHRFNEKFDIYLSRHFFWTPLFSEYYTDKYKNIDKQITAGVGLGYTLIRSQKTEWSFSGGPAFLYTKYKDVPQGQAIENTSYALELSTKYETEINKITDLVYDYKLTYTDKKSGRYKHHMVLKLENELMSWLDLDLTGIWDYIQHPTESDNGTVPYKSDYQFLVGLGIEF